jgi:hypothetical protein
MSQQQQPDEHGHDFQQRISEWSAAWLGGHQYRVSHQQHPIDALVDLEQASVEWGGSQPPRDELDALEHEAMHKAVCVHTSEPDEVVRAQADVMSELQELLVAGTAGASQQTMPAADAMHGDDSNGTAPTAGDGKPARVDPIEAFERKLSERGLPADEFEYFIHDQHGSLQAQLEGYIDDFDSWVDLTEELGMQYDQDSDINYLPEAEFGVLDDE